MSWLDAYRGLTALAEVGAWPWRSAALRRGGDAAARFGAGDARGATWVHAASVGEVTAAAPLVRALVAHRPQDDVLVSSGTPGGLAAWRRELERRPPGAAPVSVAAWPLDFPGVVRRAVERRSPRRLLVVETEIWPNLLAACLERGVRIAFANARLSERRWGTTRLLAPLVAPLLGRVSACAAQTEGDAARWARLGVPREALAVTGNTKYDQLGPAPDDGQRRAARARAGLPEDAFVVAWGSLRPGEEAALAALATSATAASTGGTPRPPLRLVAVPRHPGRAPQQARELERRGARLAEWRPGSSWPATDGALAWVPALGVLREVYALADAAVVGGTFAPFGGHNAAEPAGLGLPVLVGPHHAGVREVIEALAAVGGGRVCLDGRELAAALDRWRDDPEAHARARRAARRAIEDLGGASARTIGFLEARGFWG